MDAEICKNVKQLGSLRFRVAEAPQDIDFLRPLAMELHGESRFRNIPFSYEKANKSLRQAIDNSGTYGLLIAERGNEPVGFLFCGAGEFAVGTGDILTTIFSFFVSRKFRGTAIGGRAALTLVKGVVRWSQARNACQVMVHVTSGIDINRTDKFLRRIGFDVIGANYAFSLHKTGSDV